jgi:hypothetical protein
MRARFLQDFKAMGEGKVCYIRTDDNAADAPTKPLERAKFAKHRAYLLGMVDVEEYASEAQATGRHDHGHDQQGEGRSKVRDIFPHSK